MQFFWIQTQNSWILRSFSDLPRGCWGEVPREGQWRDTSRQVAAWHSAHSPCGPPVFFMIQGTPASTLDFTSSWLWESGATRQTGMWLRGGASQPAAWNPGSALALMKEDEVGRMRGEGMWIPSCFLLPPGRAGQLESSQPERLCLAVPMHY